MWRFISARTRGTSHIRAGSPCQDQFACTVLDDGSLVAALADGAGSAVSAEHGARIATATALGFVRTAITSGRDDFCAILRDAARDAASAVADAARDAGQRPRDFASTLLLATLGPHGGAAAQIGDGVIVVGGDGSDWSWVFWPQRGEFANTTFFLTDDDALERLQVEDFVGDITSVAMMSDGLEPLALHYETRSAHAPFFDGMFRVLGSATGAREVPELSAALERYLGSDVVATRTDDDVSLILANRIRPPRL